MKIINIIESNRGIIQQVISYVVHEDQLKDEVYSGVINQFLEMVSTKDSKITQDDLDDCLDKQMYYDQNGYVLEIIYSTAIINE